MVCCVQHLNGVLPRNEQRTEKKKNILRKNTLRFSWKCSVSSDHCTPWRWWRRRWSRSPSPSPCSCWMLGSGQGWTPWSTRNQPWRTRQSSIIGHQSTSATHLSHISNVPERGRSRLLPLRLRPSGDDAVRLGGQRERRSQMAAAQVGWKAQKDFDLTRENTAIHVKQKKGGGGEDVTKTGHNSVSPILWPFFPKNSVKLLRLLLSLYRLTIITL